MLDFIISYSTYKKIRSKCFNTQAINESAAKNIQHMLKWAHGMLVHVQDFYWEE